jgi:hypothetical protein
MTDPLQRSSEELENDYWREPNYDSYFVQTCHALRRKPLCEFTVEDLRIMIGQGIGLPHLAPLAVLQLQRSPTVQGDFYPGDLLRAVITGGRSYLRSIPEFQQPLVDVCRAVLAAEPAIHLEFREEILSFLREFGDPH